MSRICRGCKVSFEATDARQVFCERDCQQATYRREHVSERRQQEAARRDREATWPRVPGDYPMALIEHFYRRGLALAKAQGRHIDGWAQRGDPGDIYHQPTRDVPVLDAADKRALKRVPGDATTWYGAMTRTGKGKNGRRRRQVVTESREKNHAA